MLEDTYGRRFQYLRLSLNDSCNFRCGYCLPHGYGGGCGKKWLSFEEIKHLASAFRDLGIKKIRLTGGEPSLRTDLVKIVRYLKNVPSIEQVMLSTNGFRLGTILNPLTEAGLDGLNISLDSLDPTTFKKVTQTDFAHDILEAIDQALEQGRVKVKINAVLLKGINDLELPKFIDYVKNRPVSVRFIELMKTGVNEEYFKLHHINAARLRDQLKERGWIKYTANALSGPAQEYYHSEYAGRIGIIAPYDNHFCDTCNRLRVTSYGELRLCLFDQGNFDLRPYLQSYEHSLDLPQRIKELLGLKPKSHLLHQSNPGSLNTFSSIGG